MSSENTINQSIQVSTATIEYKNNILYLRMKEDAEIDMNALQEQFSVREKLVGSNLYGVLIEGHKNHNTTPEAKEYMARYTLPNRVATAIVSSNLATRIIANFYIKIKKPITPAKLFATEPEGERWLREMLDKKILDSKA